MHWGMNIIKIAAIRRAMIMYGHFMQVVLLNRFKLLGKFQACQVSKYD